MNSKITSTTRIHFFPRPRDTKPLARLGAREAEPFARAFALDIFRKRLRWPPSATTDRRSVVAKAVAYQDPGLAEIVTENLFDKIHSDPRWLPFLRKIGKAPEQLAQIKFKATLPK